MVNEAEGSRIAGQREIADETWRRRNGLVSISCAKA